MAVKKISDLLQEETKPKSLPENTSTVANSQTLKVSNSQTLQPSNPDTPKVAKYLTLENKAVRLRSDQIDDLAKLSKALNRARKSQGERITENTLIRIAIDWLLANPQLLAGLTEDEIKANVLGK